MPQYDFGTIDPATKSGSGLATDLNNWRDALHSTHKDSAAPSYKVAGTPWIDDSASPWATKIYDGADWITTGYIDPTNNSWTPAKAVTGYRAVGCDCKNNATTPNTQFDLDADLIVLADSNGYTHAIYDPGAAITNNISTAGPAANGRDQAGAFSNSSWVHFYWIWNGTTLATISSATAPPTGPTLPSGYTHWAYAGADYIDSSGNLIVCNINGNTVTYKTSRSVLSSGTATTETAISLSSVAPPNALSTIIYAVAAHASTSGSGNVDLYAVSGGSFHKLQMGQNVSGAFSADGATIVIPNLSQQMYYKWSASLTSRAVDVFGLGFTIPNGS